MAVTFQAAGTPVSGTAASATLPIPGSPNGQMLVAVFAFEGVAAGSGPWVTKVGLPPAPLPSGGWMNTFFQAPSAAGAGLQVLNTFNWQVGATVTFTFDAARTFVGAVLTYTGQYFDSGVTNPARASASQQWTGDHPATPSILAFTDELLIAVAADTLTAPGFGTPNPTGSVQRLDAERSAFGNAEVTAADFQVAAGGTWGPFTWPASASPGTAKGTTGILAVRPQVEAAPSPPAIDIPMPENLDLPDGYVLEWCALDETGANVSGVRVSNVSIFGTHLGDGGGGGTDFGPFMLVPGPAA